MEEIAFDSLIKNKVITHTELIQSVIDKQKSMPTILELIFKERLLPEEKICQALLDQEKNGGTFIQSCKNLGLWHKELEEDLKTLLDFSSKTLFEVLAKNSSGSLFKILEAYEYQLDSFKKNLEIEDSPENTESEANPGDQYSSEQSSDGNKSEGTISLDSFLNQLQDEPNLEIAPKFGHVNKELLADYTELLNTDKKSEIEDHVLKMESLSGDPQAENLRSLYRDLHSFKGAARFVQANMSETMIHNMEDLLSTIQRYLASISAHELSTAANYILKGTDIIWKLADCLERTQDEQEYWESEEKSLYLDTIRNLKGANEYIQQHKATENLREIEDLF